MIMTVDDEGMFPLPRNQHSVLINGFKTYLQGKKILGMTLVEDQGTTNSYGVAFVEVE